MKLKRIIILAEIFTILSIMTACSNESSSTNGIRICQFDGCTKKATSIAGEFCSYHEKMLNDYWDISRAAGN